MRLLLDKEETGDDDDETEGMRDKRSLRRKGKEAKSQTVVCLNPVASGSRCWRWV